MTDAPQAVATRDWTVLADEQTLEKTIAALEAHNFQVIVAETLDEARQKVLELIPEGSEVFTASSATLEASGLAEALNESGRYKSIRKQLNALNRETQMSEMRRLGASPEFIVGSVHAITEKGDVLTVSGSGSQLAGYVYGSTHVIWVVSTQKIVATLEDGLRRIEEHSLPLESARMQKLVGRPSGIGKILIARQELRPGRITIVLVKANAGF